MSYDHLIPDNECFYLSVCVCACLSLFLCSIVKEIHHIHKSAHMVPDREKYVDKITSKCTWASNFGFIY